MGYDWDAHQQTCYHLYIDEGRSLDEIMQHMKTRHDFTPSKRAFQIQFKRWHFPSKQNPAYKNDQLVTRIKELWERNLAQKEMLRILNEEDGFDIKARELIRVRAKHRWLLRVPNGDKVKLAVEAVDEDEDEEDEELDRPTEEEQEQEQGPVLHPNSKSTSSNLANLQSPQPMIQRPNRVSSVPRAAKFPSEMTIEEARQSLSLDTSTYRSMRLLFQTICDDEGISRKTEAGSDRWDTAKLRLIRDLPHLQSILWALDGNQNLRELALDTICMDITKRLRTNESRMTLAEAKNLLGINPEESRQMRATLYKLLAGAPFACKSDATPQQWRELQLKWSKTSPAVQRILEDGLGEDQGPASKGRALDILTLDVMKRFRDDRSKTEKSTTTQEWSKNTRDNGIEEDTIDQPPTAPPTMVADHHSSSMGTTDLNLDNDLTDTTFGTMVELSPTSSMAFHATNTGLNGHLAMHMQSPSHNLQGGAAGQLPQPPRVLASSIPQGISISSQVASTMLLAASNTENNFLSQAYIPQHFQSPAVSAPSVFQVPQSAYAVYLRLHPLSNFGAPPSLWIATLTSMSVQEVREVAAAKFPGTMCVLVQGMVKDGKGGELPLQIDHDQELAAYLAHLQGSPPTFNVQLVWKTS